MDFVHEPQVEALLKDTSSAYDDILVSRSLLGLANSTFNSICDKSKWRSFIDPFRRDSMCNNESRRSWWATTPALSDIKGFPSPHARSVVSHRFLKEFGALRGDLEHHVAIRNGNLGIAAEKPIEERLTAFAQTILRTIIWSCNKAIQRHRHVENNISHGISFTPFLIPFAV